MKQTLNSFLGLNQLSSLKTVIAAIIVAAILQFMICLPAFAEYSDRVDLVLAIIGILGCIVLGFSAPNKLMAYCGAVALGIPGISYSMVGYGLLEMGGFLHALGFGLLGLICYGIVQSSKARKHKIAPAI